MSAPAAAQRLRLLTVAIGGDGVTSAGVTFCVALVPGMSDDSLRGAIAGRVRGLPSRHSDGSASFYLTNSDGVVLPVSADVLVHNEANDGTNDVSLHLHPAPSSPQTSASFSSSSPEALAAEHALLDRFEAVLLRMQQQQQQPQGQPPPPPPKPAKKKVVGYAYASASPPSPTHASAGAVQSIVRLQSRVRGKQARAMLLKRASAKVVHAVVQIQSRVRGKQERDRQTALQREQRARLCGGLGLYVLDAVDELLHVLKLEKLVHKYLPGYVSKYDLVVEQMDEDDKLVHGMAKMSRLSTDMANERTLLAWVRTVLAMMRTAFATLALQGVNQHWGTVLHISTLLLLLLMALSTVVGVYRFSRINAVLSLKQVPASFGRSRFPVWPVNSIFALAVVVIALSMAAQGIEH